MKLEALLEGVVDIDLKGFADLELNGVAEHTDDVGRGDLFLALGSDPEVLRTRAREALVRGAVMVLSEVPVGLRENLVVTNLASLRGRIATVFYQDPSSELDVIGVTGTNGKTSVCFHIAAMSGELGLPCGYSGTLGWGFPHELHQGSLTTANAAALQRQLAAMLDEGACRAAVEVSSHALHQDRAKDVRFDIGIFTNLSRDHLDYHQSMEAYGNAKLKLFTETGIQTAILNQDDPYTEEIRRHVDCNVVTFGSTGDWSWRRMTVAGETRVVWESPAGCIEAGLGVHADFAIDNLTAALAALYVLGHDRAELESVLSHVPQVPGRLELVSTAQTSPAVFVDYAHTPDALDKVLMALKPLARAAGGRLICVVGCGGDRDTGKRPQMGAVATRWSDVTWLTSDNPRSEDPLSIIAGIRAGVGMGRVVECVDRGEAILAAVREAEAGDVVLIAGKGHEDYQEIQGARLPFDDRQVARQAIEELVR